MEHLSRLSYTALALVLLCLFISSDNVTAQYTQEDQLKLLPAFADTHFTGDLPEMTERGWIRALVSFSKTDFFLAQGRPRGMQAELLLQYQKFLNSRVAKGRPKLNIAYIPVPSHRLIPALLEGKGDIATALLPIKLERDRKVAFVSDSGLTVDKIVVTGKDVRGIDNLEDLSGRKVYVLHGSSCVEYLHGFNDHLRSVGKEPVKIQEADPYLQAEDIFDLVNAGAIEVTIADSYQARLWSKMLPNLVIREDLKVQSGVRLGWAVRKNNPELLDSLNDFTQQVKKGTLLGNILFNRYYVNTNWINNHREQEEHQKLRDLVLLFKKYGGKYGFDYLAIAAQAYHESGFDNSKQSPRGAFGIMQLLPTTAADPNVSISNIENVENNIHAGVKYLAFLRDNYFTNPMISEEDRHAFSWAAYNAGPAKVRKMRMRAGKMGLDPNKWFQNVDRAALELVGQETVRYVANIYKHYVAYKLIGDIIEEKVATLEALSMPAITVCKIC